MDASKIIGAVESVTKKWAKQRKAEERHQHASLNRSRVLCRSYRETLQDVAFAVMKNAYMKASGQGKYPALARQIMYAARGAIQERTGKPLDSKYFTVTLLPNFMRLFPEVVASWNVVFDARGHLIEPHYDNHNVPLGTLAVRKYLREIREHVVADPQLTLSDKLYPTQGPANRYQAILYVEKEGFHPIIEAAQIQERYDVALLSTKGIPTSASRMLVDRVCGEHDIPLLVFHDFDCAGFSILSSLSESNHRYTFSGKHKVIDLGIRLNDIEEHDLESEEVFYGDGKNDPSYKLRENGATKEEISFLYDGESAGQRVELNAFTSDKFIEWIEGKLEANGITKLVPPDDTIKDAYRRAIKTAYIDRHSKAIVVQAKTEAEAAKIPDDLRDQVDAILEETPSLSWDQAIQQIVTDEPTRRIHPERPRRSATA